MKNPTIAALFGITAAATTVAHAQSLPVDNNAELKIGINTTYNATAYASKNPVSVLPQAFYDNHRVYIEGAEAGVYPYKDAKHHVRLGVSYDGRSFDASEADSDALKQADKRKWSALAHASYMHLTPYGGLKIKATTDLLDRHDGQTVTLSHLSKFSKDAWTIYPEFGATWQSKDYNQYYYGVDAEQSQRSGLSRYDAKAGWSPFITATANYQLTDNISLFANQRIEWLSDSQKDSPLTDGKIDSKTRLGFNYQF
ncbi:MipA/OmpV family protein [Moraxella marmotae]|uniref:MipA/OmpV family protein n=1 Tax=Moraxella marmotae TaxID=3344520 RepID=UPI0035F33043